jgi:hypothetical protein
MRSVDRKGYEAVLLGINGWVWVTVLVELHDYMWMLIR